MKILLILLPISFAVSSCASGAPEENNAEKVAAPLSQVTIKRAETLAFESCMCERQAVFSGTDGANCWNEFKQETGKYFDEGYGTACYPITTNGSCSSATGQCITTDHQLMLDGGHFPLCTDVEVETFDAIFNDVIEAKTAHGMEINEADKLAQNEVRKFIELLKTGRPLELRKSKLGCVS